MQRLRFMHIPKTAGSTFDLALKLKFSPQRRFYFSGQPDDDERAWQALSDSERAAIEIFTGHAPLASGIPDANQAATWTIFRDPVERVKSFIRHVAEGKSPWAWPSDQSFSVDAFLDSGNGELSNLQTKFLVNNVVPAASLELSPQDALEQALSNADEKLDCFGIQERFDESLVLIGAHMGIGDLYYLPMNKAAPRQSVSFSQNQTDRIQEMNAIDVQLYEQLKARYAAVVANQGPTAAAVQRFQRRRALAGPVIRMAMWAKPYLPSRVSRDPSRLNRVLPK